MRIEHSMIENIDFGLNKQSIHCGIELQYCNIAGSHTFVLKSARAQLWFIDGAQVWEIPNMISFLCFLLKTQQFGFFGSSHLRHLKNSWNRIWRQIKSGVCCLYKNVQNFAFNIMQTHVFLFAPFFYTFGRIDSIQSHIKESHNDAVTDWFQLRVE